MLLLKIFKLYDEIFNNKLFNEMATSKVSVDPLAIGIDIGGTGTKFGIVDRVGNVLFSGEMSTKKHVQVEPFIDELHKKVNELIEKAGGIGRMKGIGVGAPN